MKMLIVATIVLAVAIGDFLVRGRGYLAAQEQAQQELAARVDDLAAMQRELPVISRAEHTAVSNSRDEWVERVAKRHEMLTRLDAAQVVPTLNVQLNGSRVAGLRAGEPAHQEIRRAASGSPLVEGALVRVLDAIHRTGISQVEELSVVGDGDIAPIPGLDGLGSIDFQLVAHAGLAEALDCLEALVPGATRPTLSIRTATLQRVGRERWLGLPIGDMAGPPVRLTVTIAAVYPVASDGAQADGEDG